MTLTDGSGSAAAATPMRLRMRRAIPSLTVVVLRALPSSAEPHQSHPPVSISTVTADQRQLIGWIARGMRATLDEVLGPVRSSELYTEAELVDRVDWHLDTQNDPSRRSGVLVAARDRKLGYALIRVDEVDGENVGLFGTVFVVPEARRSGVAGNLVEAGEAWMIGAGMAVAVTFTDPSNEPLLECFRRLGYTCRTISGEWAEARRMLTGRTGRALPAADTESRRG